MRQRRKVTKETGTTKLLMDTNGRQKRDAKMEREEEKSTESPWTGKDKERWIYIYTLKEEKGGRKSWKGKMEKRGRIGWRGRTIQNHEGKDVEWAKGREG